MARENVLRIRLQDQEQGGCVLVNVESAGSGPLDVKLVGTEGENPYVGSVKQRQISKLRATNFAGSEALWEAALLHILRQEPVPAEHAKELEGLNVVAAVTEASQISIVIRKNISGITQRLGSVTLTHDEDAEIALFDWAGTAAEATSSALAEMSALQSKYAEQKDTIDRLSGQLDELIKAKAEHEKALVEKFHLLLNSKKMKIRDQQRLLATAKVDGGTVEQEQPADEESGSRKPGPSRTSKRKASQKKAAESESEDDGFEKAGPRPGGSKRNEQDEDEEMADAATPDRTEAEETADDSEDEPAAAPQPAAGKGKGKGATAAKAPEKSASPPPRRELPFAKRATRGRKVSPEAQTASKQAGASRGDETDDDDEL